MTEQHGCPWFGLDAFLNHAGAVEHRRRETRDHTHVIVECDHHGSHLYFHVVERWHAVQAGAA
jgi:hypothetical protein